MPKRSLGELKTLPQCLGNVVDDKGQWNPFKLTRQLAGGLLGVFSNRFTESPLKRGSEGELDRFLVLVGSDEEPLNISSRPISALNCEQLFRAIA